MRLMQSHLNDAYFSLTDDSDIQFQVSNVINLPQNVPSGCAQFVIIPDDLVEGDHAVTFVINSISPPTTGVMINPALNTHVFTIMDDGEGEEYVVHTVHVSTSIRM